MAELPFGWRRKPLRDCPLCKGMGKILWQNYNSVPPELRCIGWKYTGKKRIPRLAESAISKERRETWMEYAARFESSCACVLVYRVDYEILKRVSEHHKRVKKNEKIAEDKLDDPLDDLFPGPYLYPEFLK